MFLGLFEVFNGKKDVALILKVYKMSEPLKFLSDFAKKIAHSDIVLKNIYLYFFKILILKN